MIIKDFILLYVFFLLVVMPLLFFLKGLFVPNRLKRVLGDRKNRAGMVYVFNGFSEKIGKKIGKAFVALYQKRFLNIDNFLRVNDCHDSYRSINIDTFIGYKIVLSIVTMVLVLVASNNTYTSIIIICILAPLAFFIPDIILKTILSKSIKKIKEELPYVSDLLYLSTLSGKNIYGSIKMIAEKKNSGIAKHFKKLLDYISTGMSKENAYKKILDSSYSADLKKMFFVLFQAEKHGSPLSQILLENSKFLRFEINQYYEKQARKSSILILFPLVFLILPSFFFLVGGPFIFSIGNDFLIF